MDNGAWSKEVMAKNIRYYTELSGKTRKQICKELGFVYSTFTDWCNAKKYPRIDKIEMMADYFGIEKSDLIEERKTGADISSGDLLHLLMIESNISDVELAHEIGISVIDLRKYEKGLKVIPFEVMKKIADYFKIDISALQGFEVKRGNNDLKTSLRILEITERWNKEIGHVEFTDSELDELIDYAKYILSKRKEK